MSETKQLTPGLFWRLLGFKGDSIDISEKAKTTFIASSHIDFLRLRDSFSEVIHPCFGVFKWF
jgi:hypothetical protein